MMAGARREPQMIEAVIERTSIALDPSSREDRAFGVWGLVTESRGGAGPRRLLAVLDNPEAPEARIDERRCFAPPDDLDGATALLAPPLALALWSWDRLNLELGELAIYTEGSPFSPLVAQAALWRGGCPVIGLASGESRVAPPGVDFVSLSDPEVTGRELRARIAATPGFAAVDLSGRPDVIDVLFEVMPRWGRMMLAGSTRDRLTIDFYNNVHRKGMLLLTGVFDPARAFDEPWGEAFLQRACRLLENREIAALCATLLEAAPSAAPVVAG
jgi:hypothetical protein